jgi:hypothetical protein
MTLPSSVNRVSVLGRFSMTAFWHIVEDHSAFYPWQQVRAEGPANPKRLSCR